MAGFRVKVERIADSPGDRPLDPFAATAGRCTHRTPHWRCGGEVSCTCKLGHGQAGLIDEDDCRGCPDATTSSS